MPSSNLHHLPMGAPVATIRIAQNPADNLWYAQNSDGKWCLLPLPPDTATYVAEAMCSANILGDPIISTVRFPSEGAEFGPAVESMTMITRKAPDA